jgi:hypothetical protein
MRISLCSMPSSRPSVAPSIVTGLLLPRPVSPVPPLAGSLLGQPSHCWLGSPHHFARRFLVHLRQSHRAVAP